MNTFRKSLGIALFLVLCNGQISAQSSNTSGASTAFFIEASNLDVKTYEALYHLVKSVRTFTIDFACVPAKLLMVHSNQSNGRALNAQFEEFKKLTTQVHLENVELLNDFNRAKFDDACSATRHH